MDLTSYSQFAFLSGLNIITVSSILWEAIRFTTPLPALGVILLVLLKFLGEIRSITLIFICILLLMIGVDHFPSHRNEKSCSFPLIIIIIILLIL